MIVWVIVLVLMLVFELATVGNLVSIWFAAGALFAIITAAFTDNLVVQVFVFAAVSLLSLIIIRPMAATFLRGNTVATNADRLIGRKVTLKSAVSDNSWGSAIVSGDKWSVASSDGSVIDEGTVVEVVAIEGVKLIVRRIKEES